MADKSVIGNLGTHVQRLIAEHRQMTILCNELTAQNNALKGEIRSQQERMKTLENDLSRMQLTEGLAGDGRDKTKARARVNRLMREVDKCIALLGTQEPKVGTNETKVGN